MLLLRVCRGGFTPNLTSLAKPPTIPRPLVSRLQTTRVFSGQGRSAFTRSSKNRSIIGEYAAPSTSTTPITVGQGCVAGGAVVGLGALCYYGLGLSSKPGIIDRAGLWPQYVKDRIKATYGYVGATIAVSAASAAVCLRSATAMKFLTYSGLGAFLVTTALLIGTTHLVYSIPYGQNSAAKHMAWLANAALIGATIAPLYLLAGPVVLQAAWSTAGIVGALSTIAICAPNEKFLHMSGPLAVGLGLVFASSLGTAFLPPTTRLGMNLYSIAVYGGLILFSMFLLHDTQRVVRTAELHPVKYGQPFDPINCAIHLYMDIINIFTRMIFMSSNSKK